MDVAHVDAETRGLRVLLVLQDDCVAVDSLLVESVGVVHIGQVIENVEGEIDVHLIKTAGLFSQLPDLFLFCSGFFSLLKCFIHIFLHLGRCRLLKQAMNFFLEFFEIFFLGLVLLLFNWI